MEPKFEQVDKLKATFHNHSNSNSSNSNSNSSNNSSNKKSNSTTNNNNSYGRTKNLNGTSSIKKPANIKVVHPNYFISNNLIPNPSPSPGPSVNSSHSHSKTDSGPKLGKEAIVALKKLYVKDFHKTDGSNSDLNSTYTTSLNEESGSIDFHFNGVNKLSRLRKAMIYLSIVLVVFCGGLDQTMSSTISDKVSKELSNHSNPLSNLTWITGAYMIALNAMFPLYGKLSDLLGRKTMLSLALIQFILGSLICSLSTTALTFILARALVGCGASGMIVIPFILIADLNSKDLSRRSLFLSLTSLALIFSNVLGPLLAGVFEDNLNFRFCYYLTFLLSLICGTFFLFVLPNHINRTQANSNSQPTSILNKLMRVDWVGTLTLILAVVLISIGLNWGGKDYGWASPQVLVTLILGLISAIAFGVVEKNFACEPIVPPQIFFKAKNSPYTSVKPEDKWYSWFTNLNVSFIAAAFSSFVNGIVVSPLLVHWIPFYKVLHSNLVLKSVENSSHLLPFLLCNGIMSTLSGVIGSKTRFKFVEMLRLGAFLIGTMTLVLAIRAPKLTEWEEITYLVVLGIGVGLTGQTSLVAAQASVEGEDVAIATSVSGFAFSMGGVLGLPVAGAILENSMPNLKTSSEVDVTLQTLQAYQKMFCTLVPFAMAGFCICLLIRKQRVEENLERNSQFSHNLHYSGSIISPITPYFKDRFSLEELANSNSNNMANSNPHRNLSRLNSYLDNIEEEKV